MITALHETVRGESRQGFSVAAGGLCLAAAPVFMGMALFTGVHGAQGMSCPAMASPFGGMAAMYLLMGLFHLPPWLRWIARKRVARRR